MKIKKLSFRDLSFAFTGGAYVMSYATQTELKVRVLRLESEDGDVGWGEVVRKPSLDIDAIAEQEIPLLEGFAGRDLTEIPSIIYSLQHRSDAFRGLAFGLETAYLDLIATKASLPLHALLGGQETSEVPEYLSLSCDDTSFPDDFCDWAVVQVKLGAGSPEGDTEQLKTVLRAAGPDQIILADFNGALSVPAAETLISGFSDPRLVWEELCYSLDENIAVASNTGAPYMFDQCLKDLESFSQVIASGVAHSVAVKPAFLGGLTRAKAAVDLCRDAGVKMRIDGPWCGHIATAASLHLAVGCPRDLLIAGCDLRQPLVLDEDWGGTRHLPGHRITPTDAPGLGVTPPF